MDFAHATMTMYSLAIFLLISAIPVLIGLLAIRVIGRSTRKTVRVLTRK